MTAAPIAKSLPAAILLFVSGRHIQTRPDGHSVETVSAILPMYPIDGPANLGTANFHGINAINLRQRTGARPEAHPCGGTQRMNRMGNGPAHYWRFRAQRYRLEGSRCTHCDRPGFPQRPGCTCASSMGAIDDLLSCLDAGEREPAATTAQTAFGHPFSFTVEKVMPEREFLPTGSTLGAR